MIRVRFQLCRASIAYTRGLPVRTVAKQFSVATQRCNRIKNDHFLQQQYTYLNHQNSNFRLLHVPPDAYTKKGLPFRTVIVLIAASSSLTMVLYVMSQFLKFNDNDDQYKQVFLPLWFKPNWFGLSQYQFPDAIPYFGDHDYFEYVQIELDQLNQNKGTVTDLENYQTILQRENIQYKLLEALSGNYQVREIFGLPLTINQPDEFTMWLESKYPTVSGLSFNFIATPDTSGKSAQKSDTTKVSVSWLIKLIRISNLVNDVLISLGLKLNRLDSEQVKIHEKSSGKIHEVPIEDKKITLNNNKDYNVKFLGKFTIQNINELEHGTLTYTGIIDFDHILINRGVKITSIDLIKQQGEEKIKYKIL